MKGFKWNNQHTGNKGNTHRSDITCGEYLTPPMHPHFAILFFEGRIIITATAAIQTLSEHCYLNRDYI